MRLSALGVVGSCRVLAAAGVFLFVLLIGIGAVHTATPVVAAVAITQDPRFGTGPRPVTQSPRIGTVFVTEVRDRPDPLYIPTLPRTAEQATAAAIPVVTPVPYP